MKIQFLFVIFCMICIVSHSYADDNKPMDKRQDESPSKLENFLSKKGVIYVKDFYDLGDIGGDGAEFKALVCYELNLESVKLKGIWIRISSYDDVRYRKKYLTSNVSFIDLYEAEILSSTLKKMMSIYNNSKNKTIDFQKVYRSASDDNVVVTLVHESDNVTIYITNGGIQRNTFSGDIKKLNELISILDNGIKLLINK